MTTEKSSPPDLLELKERELTEATSRGEIDECTIKIRDEEQKWFKEPGRVLPTGHRPAPKKKKTGTEPGTQTGIAISGGGIRSATFGLGILQALAKRSLLEKMDYLSTVSGGGFIGSSLTWWLSGKAGDRPPFGVRSKDFPYGPLDPPARGNTAADEDGTPPDGYAQLAILKFLRQHGNYLFPGGGITLMSGVAVVLGGVLLNLVVWLPILSGLMYLGLRPGKIGEYLPGAVHTTAGDALVAVGLNPGELPDVFVWMLVGAAGLAAIFVIACLIYSLVTYFTRLVDWDWYRKRRWVQRHAGKLLWILVGLLILGSIPIVAGLTRGWVAQAGIGSVLLGVASGLWSFRKTVTGMAGRVPLGLIATVGAALMLYGFLLIAYFFGDLAYTVYGAATPRYLLIAVGVAGFTGWMVNLNYISLQRYYRDRLTEAFLPDWNLVEAGKTGAAKLADKARLHEFAYEGGKGNPPPLKQNRRGPYHIVNTNVVLVDSGNRTFRTRGGDNFILSPLYCGSNATGWLPTRHFMRGKMTLATAMGISGAAMNPNTGVGGSGVTRNRMLSLLMSLLNLRMGYWVPGMRQRIRQSLPNHFLPAAREVLLPGGFAESRRFLQLSDGGHFDNTALYELIRRRLQLIVVCDGGADPKFTFEDVQTALRRVEVDFGARVKFFDAYQPETLIPHKEIQFPQGALEAQRGHLFGKITYADGSSGALILLKTTMIPNLQIEVKGYKADHPDFPDQPTSDQFFDERQVEAYRKLGYRTAMAMIDDAALEAITSVDADREEIREALDRIRAFQHAGSASSNSAS